jgi:hypothetical protein
MALVLIEGIDRTGKSTVAKYFAQKGYKLIHMSAPPKDQSPDSYIAEMVDLISSAAAQDVVLDRSHYGELIWPQVYNRVPLLNDEDITALREIEDQVGTKRIMMSDPSADQHWKRCVDNKEPLNKSQFVKARHLYSAMAHRYGFEIITLPAFLKEFPDAQELIALSDSTNGNETNIQSVEASGDNALPLSAGPQVNDRGLTTEQVKLERANAINEILSKKILRSRGEAYETLENEIRGFLNSKLGQLLGGATNDSGLTKDEVAFYRLMYKNAMKKDK